MGRKGNFSTIKNILASIMIAAIITVVIFLYLFLPFQIQGNSMSPALNNGDRIIVIKKFNRKNLKRFDIIVFRNPLNTTDRVIKRIIALPGEEISIKKGTVFINGQKLFQPFLFQYGDVIFNSVNINKIKIPKNSFYLMGDNRNSSKDSRIFGPVNSKIFLGKFFFRYWNSGNTVKKT